MTLYMSRVHKLVLWVVVFSLLLLYFFVLSVPVSATAQTADITYSTENGINSIQMTMPYGENYIADARNGELEVTASTTTQAIPEKVTPSAHVALQCDHPNPDIATNWETTLKSYDGDVCRMLLDFGYTYDNWQGVCPHQTDVYCPLTY